MSAARATIDNDVACTAGDGSRRDLIVTLGDRIIVETKNERAPSPVERTLWDLSIRPVTISTFALGAATRFPELPANKWHRTIGDHVQTVTGSRRAPTDHRQRHGGLPGASQVHRIR